MSLNYQDMSYLELANLWPDAFEGLTKLAGSLDESAADQVRLATEMARRYFRSSGEITSNPVLCRALIGDMVKALNAGPKTRPCSLAVTKLEEASMWLNETLKYHD